MHKYHNMTTGGGRESLAPDRLHNGGTAYERRTYERHTHRRRRAESDCKRKQVTSAERSVYCIVSLACSIFAFNSVGLRHEIFLSPGRRMLYASAWRWCDFKSRYSPIHNIRRADFDVFAKPGSKSRNISQLPRPRLKGAAA